MIVIYNIIVPSDDVLVSVKVNNERIAIDVDRYRVRYQNRQI